ncbi:MAG: hypothetical protein V4731_05770 [Pseudomonadota bacterium]
MTEKMPSTDLGLGLSGLDLGERVIELGHGIQLRPTFAHVFSTDILALERPSTPTSFHPGPWQATSRKKGDDVLAELFIPKRYSHPQSSNWAVGHTIVSLLRLWVDPQVAIQVSTAGSIEGLKHRVGKDKGGEMAALLHGRRDRHVAIGLVDRGRVIGSIAWVADNWEEAVKLRTANGEFDLALETFDSAQCIPNTAMMLVSIWGALEAIFAPHRAELVFRVSSQLAAFLKPRGSSRLEKQREIVKLYNLRSAAAHGSPKHAEGDIVKTYELLRIAIIRMIELKMVPSKEKLEEFLFVT